MHKREGLTRIPVAEEVEHVPHSDNSRPTQPAQVVASVALFAGTETDSTNPPSDREREIDARVDRLLGENLALMTERAALNRNMASTHERSNELLAEARLAKKLVREYFRTKRILENWTAPDDAHPLNIARDEFTAAREALESWALATL